MSKYKIGEEMIEINNEVKGNELYFAKLREDAIIPTKNDEDAGYDIYANFKEDYIIIYPNETKIIPTGICSAFSEDYYIQIQERGSTGAKGIAKRSGVFDSGFRGEWQIVLTNTNNHIVIITKLSEEEINKIVFKSGIMPQGTVYYPYTKALAQAVVLPVPKMNVQEISAEELQSIPSKRGQGKLGSSNK